jgi:DNA-binding PadR family transcriptional regulator
MKDKPATEYALLGALMSGPKHGYDMMQYLEEALGPTWRVSTSQLYVLLKRLDKEDLVASAMKTQETRPSKRVFSIRPLGKRRFLKWLNRPTDHVRDLRIEFLAKLFFFRDLGLDGGPSLVEAQVALLKEVKKTLKDKIASEKTPYKRLVYRFRMCTLEGWLTWLKQDAWSFVEQERQAVR